MNKNILKKIYRFFSSFWQYLGKVQGKSFRLIHISVALLVIIQILDSDYVHTRYGLNFGAYLHICGGMLIAVLSILLIFSALEKRGLRYYYPYLFNDYSNLKSDLLELVNLKLPNPKSGSIAAIVQGFGLVVICIAWISGSIWFIAWNFQFDFAHSLKELHKSLVGLIEFYLYVHGFMGIVHYIVKKYFPRFISDIK
ncbi:MAG: cytochrome b/b6 domain-containing protein [Francisella sp.]